MVGIEICNVIGVVIAMKKIRTQVDFLRWLVL